MKNTLMIPLVFLMNLVAWGCCIPFISVFSSADGLSMLISGHTALFFSEVLRQSVYFLPVSIMVSLLAVFVFLMRHKSVQYLSFVMIVALLFCSAVILIPAINKLAGPMMADWPGRGTGPELNKTVIFTPGLIRPEAGSSRVVWLENFVNGTRVGPVIISDSRAPSGPGSLTVFPEGEFSREDGRLRVGARVIMSRASGLDPLLEGWFTVPAPARPLLSSVSAVMDGFQRAIDEGFVPYLVTSLSYFMAVFALWLFCFSTGWRLLNILLMYSAFFALFLGYPLTSTGPAFEAVRGFIPGGLSASSVSALFYLAFVALMLACGAGVFIKRKMNDNSLGKIYA